MSWEGTCTMLKTKRQQHRCNTIVFVFSRAALFSTAHKMICWFTCDVVTQRSASFSVYVQLCVSEMTMPVDKIELWNRMSDQMITFVLDATSCCASAKNLFHSGHTAEGSARINLHKKRFSPWKEQIVSSRARPWVVLILALTLFDHSHMSSSNQSRLFKNVTLNES